MARARKDFTIRKNRQTQRIQKDLWDVIVGGSSVVTVAHSEEKAQIIADALNVDPYVIDRIGQIER